MSAGLARYLKDFSAPPPSAPEVFELPSPAEISFDFTPEPQVDLDELRREAHAEGRAEMQAEMEETHRREIEALIAQHRQNEAEMAAALEQSVADQLSVALPRMAAQVQEFLSGHVLNALRPILDEAIAERAVESLAQTVRTVFAGEGGIELVIKGPEALAERLRERLAGEDLDFRHVEAPGIDLSVEQGDTVLMTRLSAWRESVEELVK
ncbi:hypothetical protein [Rhizobium sp. C1]|uniref:hypothetical protein n=1 Tax=Rhizobium sp. C1 TaxID=1349799 RepID=UPI001E647A18|nr:hypothetical protein [Rhizobium sp. C1]MCD2179028.1 hypothetical protein [Rhizobium sp. C1]